jgi:hypothetical protein
MMRRSRRVLLTPDNLKELKKGIKGIKKRKAGGLFRREVKRKSERPRSRRRKEDA